MTLKDKVVKAATRLMGGEIEPAPLAPAVASTATDPAAVEPPAAPSDPWAARVAQAALVRHADLQIIRRDRKLAGDALREAEGVVTVAREALAAGQRRLDEIEAALAAARQAQEADVSRHAAALTGAAAGGDDQGEAIAAAAIRAARQRADIEDLAERRDARLKARDQAAADLARAVQSQQDAQAQLAALDRDEADLAWDSAVAELCGAYVSWLRVERRGRLEGLASRTTAEIAGELWVGSIQRVPGAYAPGRSVGVGLVTRAGLVHWALLRS